MGSLLDLFVKIGVKDEASDEVGKIAKSLGSGLKVAAKVGAAAVAAASTAVIGLTKTAIDSFSEYEQLAGGAQKIFDQMDASRIFADAQNAYKNFNLSANEYLALINDVGAAFASTMGDEAGYEAAQRGLQAIADYASGTGKNVNELSSKFTAITRSTSTYQSIADQFSGILPATSAAFLEQAQAAGFLESKYKSLTDVPIDEYQKAVSQMLEKGVADLNLTGNTAAETANTISGSLAALRASWSNLVGGLVNENADLNSLLSNFTTSASNAAKNLLPAVSKSLSGIGNLVQGLAPVISAQLPGMFAEVLPALISGASAMLEGFMVALPQLMIVLQEAVPLAVESLVTMLPLFIDAGLQMILAITQGIVENIDVIVAAVIAAFPQVVMALLSFAGDFLSAADQFMANLINGIIAGFTEIYVNVRPWIDEHLLQPISDAAALFIEAGRGVINKFKKGISEAWSGLTNWFNGLWDGLFGNRSVNVDVNGTSNRNAIGLDYVPYNNFLSYLHKGEAVLTAAEADEWRRGRSSGGASGITIVQNISSVPQTPAEYAAATASYFEQARWSL